MPIGPKGIDFFYPNIPDDVYILGGYILGKDTSWWGINFAYKFQLIFILFGIILNFYSLRIIRDAKTVKLPQIINLCLLLLFPYWLQQYISGVKSNSDDAYLLVYPHIGATVYLIILILTISINVNIFRNCRRKETPIHKPIF
jgi:hypothetical protein